jgi:hypothetical protein
MERYRKPDALTKTTSPAEMASPALKEVIAIST